MKRFKRKLKDMMMYKKLNLHRCDPDKNKGCPKSICYRNRLGCLGYTEYCKHTPNKDYKMNIFKRIKERIFGWK